MFQRIAAFFLCAWSTLMGALSIARTPIRDHVYATQSERQKMDIYLPWAKGEVDAVLFIHGGGWWEGDKSAYAGECKKYALRGYAAATLCYRFISADTPERQTVSYADMLDDIDAAIAALKDKLIQKGYTPRKIAITGLSAGGHLALLYGYSRRQQSAIPVAFLFADVGPSDFTDPAYQSLASGPAILEQGYRLLNDSTGDLRELSPIRYVDADSPPTITRYGGLDELVPASQGALLKAALDAAGVRGDLLIYPNSGHLGSTPGNRDLIAKADAHLNTEYERLLREYCETYF
jgi:acetyl esterase/lipase